MHVVSSFSPALPFCVGAPDWTTGWAAGSHLSLSDGDDGSEERTPVPGNTSVPGRGAEAGTVPPSQYPIPYPAGEQNNQSGKQPQTHTPPPTSCTLPLDSDRCWYIFTSWVLIHLCLFTGESQWDQKDQSPWGHQYQTHTTQPYKTAEHAQKVHYPVFVLHWSRHPQF